MARKRGRSGSGSAAPRVEARCAWCGQVELQARALEIHVGSGSEALAEFACPSCSRLNLVRLGSLDVVTLIAAGVRESDGLAPFELLEGRTGPPITWDDLIDFHETLSRIDSSQLGPRAGPIRESNPGYERDAA